MELKQLSPDEKQRRVLTMSTEWLKQAPPATEENRKFHPEFPLLDIARKCATAAISGFSEGEGMLSWKSNEERFGFRRYNDTFSPRNYDDVLRRDKYYREGVGSHYLGSVRRVGEDKVLLIWRLDGSFDHGR